MEFPRFYTVNDVVPTLPLPCRYDDQRLCTDVYVSMAIMLSVQYGFATIRYGRVTFRLRINPLLLGHSTVSPRLSPITYD